MKGGPKSRDEALGIGIVMGAGLGITFGAIFANIGLGIAFGAAVGVLFASLRWN